MSYVDASPTDKLIHFNDKSWLVNKDGIPYGLAHPHIKEFEESRKHANSQKRWTMHECGLIQMTVHPDFLKFLGK